MQNTQSRRNWLLWLLPTPGNIIFTLLIITGLFYVQNVGAVPLPFNSAAEATMTEIPYQGHITDAVGTPLNGSYTMQFSLYTQSSGGENLWTESRIGADSVQVQDGLFNVSLGSVTSLDQSVIAENDTLYLGTTVGTNAEIEPRVQLGSVPYAVVAQTVPRNSITTEELLDNSVTISKTTFLTFQSHYVDITQNGNHTFIFDHNLGHTNYIPICTAEDNGNHGRHLRGAFQSNNENQIQYAIANPGDDGTQTVRVHCLVIPN